MNPTSQQDREKQLKLKAELIQWVHDKAAMNNSLKTAEEIVEKILDRAPFCTTYL